MIVADSHWSEWWDCSKRSKQIRPICLLQRMINDCWPPMINDSDTSGWMLCVDTYTYTSIHMCVLHLDRSREITSWELRHNYGFAPVSHRLSTQVFEVTLVIQVFLVIRQSMRWESQAHSQPLIACDVFSLLVVVCARNSAGACQKNSSSHDATPGCKWYLGTLGDWPRMEPKGGWLSEKLIPWVFGCQMDKPPNPARCLGWYIMADPYSQRHWWK